MTIASTHKHKNRKCCQKPSAHIRKNHNPDRKFPRYPKRIELNSGENCLEMSIISGLKRLRSQYPELASPFRRAIDLCERRFDTEIKMWKKQNNHKTFDPYYYGNFKRGYRRGDMGIVATILTEKIFATSGYRFVLHRLPKTVDFEKLLKARPKKRANRIYIAFGHSPCTVNKPIIVTKVKESEESCHTLNNPFREGFFTKAFFARRFSQHAIAFHYDAAGNGTLDDPSNKVYKELCVSNLLLSMTWETDVFSMSLRPT